MSASEKLKALMTPDRTVTEFALHRALSALDEALPGGDE